MITYTRELVLKKVRDMFPAEEQEKVLNVLDQYGVESYEKERERVQLAILKLSQGKLDKLEARLKTAKADYRDALTPAEYPSDTSSEYWGADAQGREAIKERDRRQYLEWLYGELPS